jgi:hypothetical protein
LFFFVTALQPAIFTGLNDDDVLNW